MLLEQKMEFAASVLIPLLHFPSLHVASQVGTLAYNGKHKATTDKWWENKAVLRREVGTLEKKHLINSTY